MTRKSEIDELMAEAAARDAEKGRRGVRTMPEELMSAIADSPLDLPRVVIPASVAALIEERAEGAQPIPGPRPRLERRADFSETAEVAVGPPPPEVAPWGGRWEQDELGVDIAALMQPDEQAGEGVGLALTAAWAAIAPVPKYTQDALDFGELPRTVRTVPGASAGMGLPGVPGWSLPRRTRSLRSRRSWPVLRQMAPLPRRTANACRRPIPMGGSVAISKAKCDQVGANNQLISPCGG